MTNIYHCQVFLDNADTQVRKMINQGFTLIELLITIAIIGILASVTFRAYSVYFAKSQFTSAMEEIAAGKATMENMLSQGIKPLTADDISLQSSTKYCTQITIRDETSTTGDILIRCQIKGNHLINGKVVRWRRNSSSGTWRCTTNAISKYIGTCENGL
ncbi:Type IV pilin PilA [Gammaproteobacteria bacterium]